MDPESTRIIVNTFANSVLASGASVILTGFLVMGALIYLAVRYRQ